MLRILFFLFFAYIALSEGKIYAQTPTVSLYTASGRVFFDNNYNGIEDPGESPDRTVRPYIRILNTSGQELDRVRTDDTGNYIFTGLSAGNYSLDLLGLTTTMMITTPQPIPYPVTLGPSQIVNFGIAPVLTPTLSKTSTPSFLLGDFNKDDRLDLLDFNIWRDEFLGNTTTKLSDANTDLKIDLVDFNTWLTAFRNANP